MPNTRVFVREYGLISPLGLERSDFLNRLFSGNSGTRDIRGSDFSENFPVRHGGWVEARAKDLKRIESHSLQKYEDRSHPGRSYLMAALALDQLLLQLPEKDVLPVDGIVWGTPEGVGFEVAVHAFEQRETFEWRFCDAEASANALASWWQKAGHPAIAEDQILSLNAACATGNQALGLALQRLRSGQWKRALVGGVDARLTPSSVMNFHMLSALTAADVPSESASRPFDQSRSGFVRGEGAAVLLLEAESCSDPHNRMAELSGYGSTCDAYRLTDPRDDGSSLVQSMKQALEDSGIRAQDIGYVSAHGTSTPLNDRMEAVAIAKLLGSDVWVSSLKSQIGHTTVAAGAIETIACVEMLRSQKLAPNINLKNQDPECPVRVVRECTPVSNLDYVLNNNLAFGGQNVCVVLKRVGPA